jgi:Zn-finger nucleic acid-binding protein
MNKEYKVFMIRGMYNTITASGPSLRDFLSRKFFKEFGIQPDIIEVFQEDKYAKADNPKDVVWIGTLTLKLTIDGESYSVTRDFNEEHENDIKHPCYNDDYFYESESCFSHKKKIELLKSLND